MKHKISGSTTITGLTGPLAAFNGVVGARANLNLPAIGSVGFRHEVTKNLFLLGEFAWYDWSTFREVRIQFDDGRADAVRPSNYRDAYGVSVGAEYRVSDTLSTRGGVHFDTTPTVDGFRDTTVPDSDRLWLGLGATLEMSKESSVDFAFSHVFFRHTNIALTRTFFDGTPLATAVRINGSVKSVVDTISVDYRWGF
jgi:long-chain fatty acid transport protein